MSTLLRLSALLVSVLLALPASAAQRTFVASFGLDTNPCSITSPCRTFTAALTQTAAGGEVIVLDSAGYGAFTITQSVSIIAPDGVYAGVSVFTGDGITVSAGATDAVILRGLHINGQGGNIGILITTAGSVHIEKCVIAGMPSGGISFFPSVAMRLAVHDTTVRGGASGLAAVAANALGAASQLRVSRSSFSDASGPGISITDISRANISDTESSGNNNDGLVFAATALSTANPNANVDRVQLVGNGFGLVATASGGVDAVVNVSGSVIANNSNHGVLAGNHGFIRLTGTQVTGNLTGVEVQAGGTVASPGTSMVAGNETDHVGAARQPITPY